MIPNWVEENRYTDIPFMNLGRDTTGWDCYGLVQYISGKHYGKRLPEVHSYVNANDVDDTINTIKHQVKAWKRVYAPNPGDVILFRFKNLPVHCGLVLDENWMIHVMSGCMTAVEQYTKFPWNQRYDSAYTYN